MKRASKYQFQNQCCINDSVVESINRYIEILLDYNTRINLVSRRISHDSLTQLLNESVLLSDLLSYGMVVDAGSGNGILGIPIAILNRNKNVVLVEPKKKKNIFLRELKNTMGLLNVDVYDNHVEEYLKEVRKKPRSLISRGFPDFSIFCRYIRDDILDEVLIITSINKINKNRKHMENIGQKAYNLPLRTHLKILKMEKTGIR